MAYAKKAALKNERKAEQEARDQAMKVLIDARALAEKYHVTYTDLDKAEDIIAKVEAAKKSGIVADGDVPPEIKKASSLSKRGPAFEDREISSEEELFKLNESGKTAGFSGWYLEKETSEGNVEKIPTGFIPGAKAIARVALSVFLALGFFGGVALAASSTDEAVLGNDRWSVTSGGDLIPNTADAYDIGSSSYKVDNLYVKTAIVLNGVSYTSFAAGTDGNWTDQGLTVTLDKAPTKFIATISSGDLAATSHTAGTGGFIMENAAVLGNAANGTVTITEASDALSFIFSGSTIQLDSSDGGFQFAMSSGAEGYVDFLTNADASDYLRISTVERSK